MSNEQTGPLAEFYRAVGELKRLLDERGAILNATSSSADALRETNNQLQQSNTKCEENYAELQSNYKKLQQICDGWEQAWKKLQGDYTQLQQTGNQSQNIPESELVEDLRKQIKKCEDQIFKLAGSSTRDQIYPGQAKEAYNNIVFDVGTFVQTRMESLWRNNEHFDKAGIWARTGMYDFHNELLHFPDLYTTVLAAGNTSDIDDEILESFILRRIQHVFNLGLEAINPTVGRALGWAEQSMRNEKRLAEYQIRNWRAETQFALLQDPQIQKDWQTHKDAFLNAMARVLGFLAKGDEDHDAFVNDMATEIVNPTYKLLEQCLGTTSGFSLGTQTIGMLGQNFHGKLADLMKVQCQNVISGMNYFRVDRINPAPSENQLHRELHIMCSLSPSFLYFQASPTTIAKENAILQPELLMVAWRAGEDGQSAISTLPKTWDRPILYGLLTACLQTQTKGN